MAAGASRSRSPAAPVVTLTTDFGTRDPFVGIMKGVILCAAPDARIVDLTHHVPAQNVVAGAHVLASATRWFPRGTIHIAVVDPGVGTRRRALLVETAAGWLVGPDNGLLSLAAPSATTRRILDVSRSRVRLRPVSRTFHGRDVFAPVAAALAVGAAPETLGKRVRTMARLQSTAPRRHGGRLVGEVLWADGFGNLATNIRRSHLECADFRGRRLSVTIATHVLPLRPSYASVPRGGALALINSSDLLEVAVNGGSAAERFAGRPGSTVTVSPA